MKGLGIVIAAFIIGTIDYLIGYYFCINDYIDYCLEADKWPHQLKGSDYDEIERIANEKIKKMFKDDD